MNTKFVVYDRKRNTSTRSININTSIQRLLLVVRRRDISTLENTVQPLRAQNLQEMIMSHCYKEFIPFLQFCNVMECTSI